MKMNKLYSAAERAVKQSLRLRKGEYFLLVTDRDKMEIAEALAYWAKESGAETTTYLMTETLRPITAPTRLFKLLAEKATAIAYMLDARIQEKPLPGVHGQDGHETVPHLYDARHHPGHDGAAGQYRLCRDGALHQKSDQSSQRRR